MPRQSSDSDLTAIVTAALQDKHPEFEAFVRARVRPDEVDDLVQLAALKAIERASTLDDPARVEAWLYRIHRNLIVDTHRRRATISQRRAADDDLPEPATLEANDSCGCSVMQATRLKPNYASILSMVDTAGLDLAEAASQLGITPNNAAVRLHRARTALRQAMLEHCGVTDARACAGCRCIDDACCAA